MFGLSESEVVDGPLKAGRAVGATGGVLGGLFVIMIALTPFMVIPKPLFIIFGNIAGIFMALFSLTLPVGLATDFCTDEYTDSSSGYYDSGGYYSSGSSSGNNQLLCKPTVKGYLAGGAFVLWIVGTSIVCCCMGTPRSTQESTTFGGAQVSHVKEGQVLHEEQTHDWSHFEGDEIEYGANAHDQA